MPALHLRLLPGRLTVCQLPADAPLPDWASARAGFLGSARTDEELSIVCPESLPPPDVRQEPGWRMFKIEGPMDFTLTGILAVVIDPLARTGISIFSISTFNTDYVLVKSDKTAAATAALRTAGHTVQADD